jgi:hypothetical protein
MSPILFWNWDSVMFTWNWVSIASSVRVSWRIEQDSRVISCLKNWALISWLQCVQHWLFLTYD